MRAGSLGATLTVLVALACATPTDTCACTLPGPPTVVVSGTAADSVGLPLTDVVVSAVISDADCARGLATASSPVDRTGRFELFVPLESPPDALCALVRGVRYHATGRDTVYVERRGVDPVFPLAQIEVELLFPVRGG